MKRFLLARVFACSLLLVLCQSARPQDEIRYYDRAAKKEARLAGAIQEEDTAGIKVVPVKGSTVKSIPAQDIVEITYQMPASLRLEYRKPFAKEERASGVSRQEERKKLWTEAVQDYQELLPKLSEAKFPRRYAQYRMVQLLARLAEDDPTQREPAIEGIKKFLAQHQDGWEVIPASRLLAHLQEEKNDQAGAQKTHEDLAAWPGVPAETRQESHLYVVRALLANNKPAEAERKLQDLSRTLPAKDPQAARVQVYLAKCRIAAGNTVKAEADLKAVLTGPADASVKGFACNTLADFYRRANRPEDAFWQYLWVDVVYSQDKEQHAEALYHLATLFDEVRKDTVRAQQCRERLIKDKEFAGQKYQALAQKQQKQP